MRDRQTCVGCGKKSPETETNYTLISAQFGWRLTRYQGPDGSLLVEWRCPTCWRDFKRARTAGAGGVGGAPASPVPPPPAEPTGRTPPPRRAVGSPAPTTPLEALRPRLPSDSGVRRPPTPFLPTPTPAPAPSEPVSGPPSSGKHDKPHE